jgi:hypothetical protein
MDQLLQKSQEELVVMLIDKEEELISLQSTVKELKAQIAKVRSCSFL